MHKREYKNYSSSNIKITKTPLNQTQCHTINNNSHLNSKKLLNIVKSNSLSNYSIAKIH